MTDQPDSQVNPHVIAARTHAQVHITANATGRVIPNFAWQHLKAATLFRDHVLHLESSHADQPLGTFFEELRSYASGCIMSSTASIEALINELFIAHNSRLREKLTDFETAFWGPKRIEHKPILKKYQLALDMLEVARLAQRGQLYRDTWCLIELRNALIHYKPTWITARQRTVELEDLLGQRFAQSPFSDSSADFVSMKYMSAGCTKWAVESTLSFMRAFDERTHLDEGKMAGFWMLGT